MAPTRQAEGPCRRCTASSPPPTPALASLPGQLAEEARRLHTLAAAARAHLCRPEVQAYLGTPRGGPAAYQRDYERWLKTTQLAYAFEDAAARLEQTLAAWERGR